ncbi:hypothetical protein BGW80DRAFT_1561523 [Lactifluus volemus]|nr:hypothetical protein BGW80DRAFT_1561523 [Lactifluus volemus]
MCDRDDESYTKNRTETRSKDMPNQHGPDYTTHLRRKQFLYPHVVENTALVINNITTFHYFSSHLSPHFSMNPLQRTRKLISDVSSSSQSRSNDIPPYSPFNTSPSKIHKIGKRMGWSKGSRWIRRLCRISPRVTICSLPDEVLLDIFEFCLHDPVERRAKAWPKLVHVCQRWRYIVFASPLRLDLCLLCRDRTPVREMLDIWPPLPIQIVIYDGDLQDEDNIIAALECPNRVRSIEFNGWTIPLERLVTVMQEPFPGLESLSLSIGNVLVLPNTFLGGSAPRLRSLHLTGIPFPTLPRLLLSSNDLVHLHLDRIPQNGYISPEAMATCVSALISLTELSICFISPTSRPDPITRHPPPLTRAVLPALTNFVFQGVSGYLEDLVAQIYAPLLRAVRIRFFNQLVFSIQQLPRFIGHSPALTMPYNSANISIHGNNNNVRMFFSATHKTLSFTICCRAVDWQVSSMAQICNQLSFILSSIDQLNIDNSGSIRQVDMDDTQWLELLQPFTAVQTLRILSHDIESLIVPALRGLSGELATQVLPALEELQLSGYQPSQRYNWPFIIARQHSDHPVVLGGLKWQQ